MLPELDGLDRLRLAKQLKREDILSEWCLPSREPLKGMSFSAWDKTSTSISILLNVHEAAKTWVRHGELRLGHPDSTTDYHPAAGVVPASGCAATESQRIVPQSLPHQYNIQPPIYISCSAMLKTLRNFNRPQSHSFPATISPPPSLIPEQSTKSDA
jgi:hypothetical protein